MTRPPRLLALIPAAFALILYLLTCSPTINFLDSGELTTVAWTAGIAHPPGYPLYTLLSTLFIRLPFGDPAWRMNVLSALFGALAVGLFYGFVADTLAGMPGFLRAVARPIAGAKAAAGAGRARPAARATPAAGRPAPRGKETARTAVRGATATLEAPAAAPVAGAAPASGADPAPAWAAAGGALTAAGLLACSLTFWNWATQAKMYTLHFAFMAGLLWLGLRARRALYQEVAAKAGPAARWPPRAWSPGIRLTHGLALLAGLSMTNHYLSNLLWVGMAVLLLTPIGRAGTAFGRILRHSGTILAAGLAPLLLYLYLPLRAGMQPLLDWGSPDSWGDFWRHVTVWQFSVYIGRDAAGLGGYIGDAAVFAANQLGLPLTLLLLAPMGAGLVWLWRTDRGLLIATVVTAIIDLVYTLNYQIREVVVYYIPFYMVALFWAGLGVAWGLGAARARLPAVRQAPAWAALALGALLPLLGLLANWGAAGHPNDRTAEIFTRNAFQNFKPNAVVLTNSWDLVAGSYYLQHVRGERTDVAIIDKALFRYPFYVSYLERVYPDLIRQTEGYLAAAPPAAAGQAPLSFAEFKARDRHWVDAGNNGLTNNELARLGTLYTGVLNGFIDASLGKRPVYVIFGDTDSETQQILTAHQQALVPDGLGFRVSTGPNDRATTDPGFDLRGLTSEATPLDEVAYSVIWMYPRALQQIGGYLSASGPNDADKALGARLLAQAQQLAPFGANPESRPHLR